MFTPERSMMNFYPVFGYSVLNQLLKPALCLGIGILGSALAIGQQLRPVAPITCYAGDHAVHTHIPAPQFLENARSSRSNSDFEFTFISVPQDVQQAVLFASDIWANILVSQIAIRVEVTWENLAGNTLASSGPTQVFQSSELQDPTLWYPVALAESILERELNDVDAPDIRIILNQNRDWYTGTDARPPRNEIDLVTVILHELAHGLGFFDTSDEDENGEGLFGIQDRAIIYDRFLVNGADESLLDEDIFPNPSPALINEFESDNIFFNEPEVALANGGANPQLFAPDPYTKGSSISHLDEDAFPPGDPNSLMSPVISPGEANHDPGVVTNAIMEAIGWNQDPPPPIERTEVFISPNPVRTSLGIELPSQFQGEGLQLEVWDIAGRIIREEVLEGLPEIDLEVGFWSPGVYVLRLQREGETSTSRFLVVK